MVKSLRRLVVARERQRRGFRRRGQVSHTVADGLATLEQRPATTKIRKVGLIGRELAKESFPRREEMHDAIDFKCHLRC